MNAPYNAMSGRSRERVRTLSDGIFAVAMTLLVLDLRVPVAEVHSDHALWHALTDLGPNFAAYVLSFSMLGTFWLAQHTFLGIVERTDRTLTWIQIGYLFAVSVLPFSASLLAEYARLRLAVGVYWCNILLLGLALAAGCWRAGRAKLVQDRVQLEIFTRRILLAQVLYGAAALLCLANTYVSIGALALVQLYFIVSPQRPAQPAAPAR